MSNNEIQCVNGLLSDCSNDDCADCEQEKVRIVQLDESWPIKPSVTNASPLERPATAVKPRRKRGRAKLNAPWKLHFDRDGTEDYAIICDSHDYDLATSRFFWLPEEDDDILPTLAGMRVMVCAPELLTSLREMVSYAASLGRFASAKDAKRIAKARAVIAKATGK